MPTRVRQLDTHRLLNADYSERRIQILERIAAGVNLNNIYRLKNATDPRIFIVAEGRRIRGTHIGPDELVFNIPYYWIINGAFVHAGNAGSRFNDANRGTWYAAFNLETSISEISWHKVRELQELNWKKPMSVYYDDYLADFSGEYHDIRRAGPSNHSRIDCLSPNSDYLVPQNYAGELLNLGSLGLLYPSVRDRKGYCIACFRPALVTNVRKHAKYRLTWLPGNPEPEKDLVELYDETGG